MFDIGSFIIPSITFGNIIEILVIAGGGLITLSKFTTKFALLHADVSSFKTNLNDMKVEVSNVKTEMKQFNILLANSHEQDRRIGRLEDSLHRLSRGDGWVTRPNRTSVDGEYPTPRTDEY